MVVLILRLPVKNVRRFETPDILVVRSQRNGFLPSLI
jgi:hypothetical protein